MNVDRLIGYVATRYRTARFYSDRGIRTCNLGDGTTTRAEFGTGFERGGRFSFVVKLTTIAANGRRLLTDGHRVVIADPDPWPEDRGPLGRAIAALAGVSVGTAHTVSRLLMPDEVGGVSIFEHHAARKLGPEVPIDGAAHYVVRTGTDDDFVKIYIAKTSFVVRRIEERRCHEGLRVMTTDLSAVLSPAFPS